MKKETIKALNDFFESFNLTYNINCHFIAINDFLQRLSKKKFSKSKSEIIGQFIIAIGKCNGEIIKLSKKLPNIFPPGGIIIEENKK